MRDIQLLGAYETSAHCGNSVHNPIFFGPVNLTKNGFAFIYFSVGYVFFNSGFLGKKQLCA